MADGEVLYQIRSDDSQIDGDLDKASQKIEKGTSKWGSVLKTAGAAIGGAAIAAGTAAIKFGSDFETSMAGASTLFGDAQVNTDDLNAKMLALSDSSGIAADQLGNSLYNALSAGIPATDDMSEAVDFLDKSTKLAKAGFTDIDTAMSATVKTLNAYGMGVEETDRVQKILMQTQNKGIVTVGELGGVLAQVTPTAAAMGVEFEQVGAGLAVMTAAGTPAAQATTQLNGLFAELGKSGTTGQKALAAAAEGTKYAGKSFQDLMKDGVPLSDVLDLIGDYADENGLSMLDMFSSIDAGKAALSMSGENASKFTDALSSMSTETDVVGDAFDKVSNTTAEKFNKVLNGLKNTAISLFAKMEPLITKLLPVLANLVEKLLPPLIKIADAVLTPLVGLIEVLAEPLAELAGSILPLLAELFTTLAEPLIALISAILPPLIDFISQLMPLFNDLVGAIMPQLLELFTAIIEPLSSMISAIMPILIDLFNQLITPLVELLGQIMPVLITVFKELIPPLAKLIENILPILTDLFLALIVPLMDILNAIMPPLIKIIEALLPPIMSIIEALEPLIELFALLIKAAIEPLMPVIKFLAEILTSVLSTAIQNISSVLTPVIKIFSSLIDFIKNVFAGNWKGAWEAVKNIFGGIWEGIKNLFKIPINWIIDGINLFLKALNKIKIPDWIPGIGGFGINIPLIPRLKKGMSFVPSDYFPAYLDYGERVLTAEQNSKFNALGGLQGMDFAMSGKMSNYGHNKTITIVTPVEVDGREIARATATYTSEQMSWEDL